MGISSTLALRAKVSMITINIAPIKQLNGITLAVLLPAMILAICGIISPTQPMIPQMLTRYHKRRGKD